MSRRLPVMVTIDPEDFITNKLRKTQCQTPLNSRESHGYSRLLGYFFLRQRRVSLMGGGFFIGLRVGWWKNRVKMYASTPSVKKEKRGRNNNNNKKK